MDFTATTFDLSGNTYISLATRMNALAWYRATLNLQPYICVAFVALRAYRDKDYGNSSNAQGTERPMDDMWRLSCDWLKNG